MKKITKKAWGINWSKINDGEYYRGNVEYVYASTINKAKTLLLPDMIEYNRLDTGKEITYITIPVIRYKMYDKFDFDGKELTENEYQKEVKENIRQKKLDIIISDKNIKYCYIYKQNYYCDNWCGYTNFKIKAGIYKKLEAVKHARDISEIDIIPINIKEHNNMINDEINKLSSKLIKE